MSGLPPLHRRLSEKLPGWQAIGTDPTTLKWIKHGVPVEFLAVSCLFVGSDPDPSLFWCNDETAFKRAMSRAQATSASP